MRRLESYVVAGGRQMRCGYTTGTCAAAAARAAAELLLGGERVPAVSVSTPAGQDVLVDVEASEAGPTWATCAVRKDAGDDPDVTDGVLVYARVERCDEPGVHIDGGEGVGRVTRAGLDQPPGCAAINSVPRAMIEREATEAARSHAYGGGLAIEVSIPQGVALAQRTFNPRLGIEGGISVLGTEGIVRPMSERALVETIRLELGVLRQEGVRDVLVVPGNYGRAFARDALGMCVDSCVSCSNYVGETIDEAVRLGFGSLLLVGHLGKLAKVAGGVMNTHSRIADCRMEVLAAHAALAGASAQTIARVMDAATTDAAVDELAGSGLLEPAMDSLMERLHGHLRTRAAGELCIEAVVFSQARGVLGTTKGADALLQRHVCRKGERE